MIAGILLAAGRSARFGAPKLLHSVEGQPLICHSLSHCVASQLPHVYVVIGSEGTAMRAAIEKHFAHEPTITVLRNDAPERGLMSSLKIGLASLGPDCDAAMVLLADMPRVSSELINELVRVYNEEDAFVIPECGGVLRHPRIIPRRHFPSFMALGDSEKGSAVIDGAPGEVCRVAIGNPADYVDIDRVEDLDSLEG